MNLALRARKAAGLSQAKLADALGVSRQTLIRWEASDEALPAIVTAFLRVLEAHPGLVLETLGSFNGPVAGGGPSSDSEPGTDEPRRATARAAADQSFADDGREAGG